MYVYYVRLNLFTKSDQPTSFQGLEESVVLLCTLPQDTKRERGRKKKQYAKHSLNNDI